MPSSSPRAANRKGPGDAEQLAGLGDGVDEALVWCLRGLDGGAHGRQAALWTSTETSTETYTAGRYFSQMTDALQGPTLKNSTRLVQPCRKYTVS
jgi:hypothetical protein